MKIIDKIKEMAMSQVGLFIISGGIITLFDMGLLFILTEYLGVNYLLSAGISFLIASVFNYIVSRKWIFKRGNFKAVFEYNLFLLFSLAGIFMNHGILWFFTEVADLHYIISKVISIVLITIFNFFTRKHIVFRKKEN